MTLWGSDPAFCKCLGGGGGGLQHSFEDVRVLAVGSGGGGVSDVLKRGGCGIVGGVPACCIGTVGRSLVGLTAGTGPVVAEVAAFFGNPSATWSATKRS